LAPLLLVSAKAQSPSPSVVAWGDNSYGQTTTPAGLGGVIAVAAGNGFTVALKSDGTVVAWGLTNLNETIVPSGLAGVVAIAAADGCAVALKSDGTVVAWGNNFSGQTNIPAGLNGVTAIAEGGSHTVALKSDGTVVAWGNNSSGQTNIPAGLSGVTAIAAGEDHTVALKSDGTMVAWGAGATNARFPNFGQSMIPSNLSGVMAIAAGAYHTVALKSNGTVVAWGSNNFGQTNVPAALSGVTAIAAGEYHTLSLTGNGTVAAWGANFDGQASVPAGLSAVTAIAAGWYHSAAVGKAPPSVTLQPQSVLVNLSSNATFSVAVVGTSPFSYQWRFNSADILGATNATYDINNVETTDAGIYSALVANAVGSATSSNATLSINIVPSLSNLAQSYDGTARSVVATTTPAGLMVRITYDGSSNAPTNAGTYTVIGSIEDPYYQGSVTNLLVISKGAATISLGGLAQTADGTPKSVTVITVPAGLLVSVTYDGLATAPTSPGSYNVTGVINDPNYLGSTSSLLVIGQAGERSTQLALSFTTSVLPSGDQSFVLEGHGPAGTDVLLEYATNLMKPNWATLTFFTLPGQIEEAYDIFDSAPVRYYRLNAGSSMFANPMFQGIIRYAGNYPNPTNIAYQGIDGTAHTAVGAYPGWLELIADTSVTVPLITNFIQSIGGTVRSAIPAAGLYWVQVAEGSEAVTLSNCFTQAWLRDGFPATPAVFGSLDTSIDVLDWDDPHGPSGGCARRHMTDVADIAGSRRPYDLYDRNDPQTFDVHDRTATLPAEVLLRMKEAYDAHKRVTINLSLESPDSAVSMGDASGCMSAYCGDVRTGQYGFFEGLLQMLETTSATQAGMADNTLVSIIAGNAGVDLDQQIALLKAKYPNGFARMVIVGGTDLNGNISRDFNHLTDNTVPNMVYARAWAVQGCNGTSFAAPEVTSVLDTIWSQATNKTSAQILAAFHQAMGTNNIIPAGATGRVTTNFINQVVGLLTNSFTIEITTAGTGTGAVTASPPGPLYTNGAIVTLTAVPDSGSQFAGWSGDATGSANATVTMNASKAVTATFNSAPGAPAIAITSVIKTITDHNSLWTDFSVSVQGTTSGQPSAYTYEAGWGIYGTINRTLTANPESWSFTFTFTQFPGPTSTYQIWCDEYDGLGKLAASDSQAITFSY